MRAALLLLLVACAGPTAESLRRMGPYGPMPLPEEMPAGRVQCRALCSSYARDFDAYTYEGACVCKPDPKAHQQYNGNQTRRTGWPHSKGST